MHAPVAQRIECRPPKPKVVGSNPSGRATNPPSAEGFHLSRPVGRLCRPSCIHYQTGRTIASRLPRRSEEHTSELQSLAYLVCRLLLEKKKKNQRQVLMLLSH